MNDRLGELRSALPSEGGRGGYGADVEMGAHLAQGAASGAQGGAAFMSDFFAEIAKVKAAMAVIRGNIRLIEQHHGQCLTAISVEQGRASNEKLEALTLATNAAAGEVRNKLKAMDAANKGMMRSDPGSSEVRIRCYQHGTLTRKFVDLMSE